MMTRCRLVIPKAFLYFLNCDLGGGKDSLVSKQSDLYILSFALQFFKLMANGCCLGLKFVSFPIFPSLATVCPPSASW